MGIIGLPEVLQAQILEFAGNAAASSLSLASQDLHIFLWQSMEVWQARLALTGTIASIGQMTEFRREYRWKVCGIDALCWPGMQSACTGDHAMVHASRAVKSFIAEDAAFSGLMASTLTELIRSYDYTDDFAHRAAEALVQDISACRNIFKPEHIRDISLAYDSACWMREMLLKQNSELEETLEEQLMDDFPGFPDEPDDVSELASGCNDEAMEHVMELLRSLPESV